MSAREPEPIERSLERTEQLLADLSGTQAELLSVRDLNRALRQVLANQALILQSLAGPRRDAQSEPEVSQTAPAEAASGGRQADPPPPPEQAAAADPPSAPPRNGQAPTNGGDSSQFARHIRFEVPETLSIPPPSGDTEASPAGERSLAEELLNETRVLEAGLARACVAQFDNRDNDYAKGLEKLNRWTAGGTGGTPFQWRGERAYLNVNGASPSGVRNYDEQLMNRMGFGRRIGRLVVPGLQGEVVVYERP